MMMKQINLILEEHNNNKTELTTAKMLVVAKDYEKIEKSF